MASSSPSSTHPITLVVDEVVYRLTMDALVSLQAFIGSHGTDDERNDRMVVWLAAADPAQVRVAGAYVEN